MVMAHCLPLLVTIVGPTAAGKTELSLELAESVDGEIISADSRLVYRGMNIGTAKPTLAQRTRVPHHLIDIVDPDDVLTLAQYQRRAYASIDAVTGRGRQPILVGGTGQYVRAVVEGWGIPEVPPDHGLRAELEEYAGHHGAAALHTRLSKLDPIAASRIDLRNVRRVIRALEVTLLAGRPISELQAKSAPPYLILQIGLTRPRPVLYERIDARIDRMLASGLLEEVQRLALAGYGWDLPAMSGLGYRQIGLHLQGKATLEEATQFIRRDTRRLVRQQGTWFRLADPHIHWFDLEQVDTDRVVPFVQAWLANPRLPIPLEPA
jgi:tRNA dimethylallyltransferase